MPGHLETVITGIAYGNVVENHILDVVGSTAWVVGSVEKETTAVVVLVGRGGRVARPFLKGSSVPQVSDNNILGTIRNVNGPGAYCDSWGGGGLSCHGQVAVGL
jgi:hypothetical protein